MAELSSHPCRHSMRLGGSPPRDGKAGAAAAGQRTVASERPSEQLRRPSWDEIPRTDTLRGAVLIAAVAHCTARRGGIRRIRRWTSGCWVAMIGCYVS